MGLMTKETKAALRRGAWYKTVNNPIPAHVLEHAARSNPFHGAIVIGKLTAAEYRDSPLRFGGTAVKPVAHPATQGRG